MNSQILENFLRVTLYSTTRPIKLATLISGLVFGIIVPNFGWLIILFSFGSLVVMIAGDLANKDFVDRVLLPQIVPKKLLNQILSERIAQLQSEIESSRFLSGVLTDLIDVRNSLAKIQNTIDNQNYNALSLQFVEEYLPSVLDKFNLLCKQKVTATNYLKTESQKVLELEIKKLTNQSDQISDAVSRQEYQKAIDLKHNQIAQIKTVEQKLIRINSQIVKIKAALEQSNSHLIKLNLADTSDFYDESELLTESLKQITKDQ